MTAFDTDVTVEQLVLGDPGPTAITVEAVHELRTVGADKVSWHEYQATVRIGTHVVYAVHVQGQDLKRVGSLPVFADRTLGEFAQCLFESLLEIDR